MVEFVGKRGRPKGSGRHQKSDVLLLPIIADKKLAADLSLATIIRDLIDTKRDTGGVRRLQRAFQAQGETLMAAARLRRQEKRWREVAEGFQICAGLFLHLRDLLADKLDAWARSPEGRRAAEVLNSPDARKLAAFANTAIYKPPKVTIELARLLFPNRVLPKKQVEPLSQIASNWACHRYSGAKK